MYAINDLLIIFWCFLNRQQLQLNMIANIAVIVTMMVTTLTITTTDCTTGAGV